MTCVVCLCTACDCWTRRLLDQADREELQRRGDVARGLIRSRDPICAAAGNAHQPDGSLTGHTPRPPAAAPSFASGARLSAPPPPNLPAGPDALSCPPGRLPRYTGAELLDGSPEVVSRGAGRDGHSSQRGEASEIDRLTAPWHKNKADADTLVSGAVCFVIFVAMFVALFI